MNLSILRNADRIDRWVAFAVCLRRSGGSLSKVKGGRSDFSRFLSGGRLDKATGGDRRGETPSRGDSGG